MSTDQLKRSRSFEATVTSVASSTDVVQLYDGSDKNCEGIMLYNDSTSDLYVKFGADASTSSFTFKLVGGGWYESPTNAYVGELSGIWTSADGNALITKLEN